MCIQVYIKQKWICQSHGIFQLPCSFIFSKVLPLQLELHERSVPENYFFPVHDAIFSLLGFLPNTRCASPFTTSAAMEAEGGVPQAPSYSSVTAKEHGSHHSKRPTFELPPDMQRILWEEEMLKEKPMDIDPASSNNKTNCTWEPGKCILQASTAPKYNIISPRIEEQKQYMRDFALIGKLLGLWPSEKDLIKWIQHWWKPKGHYDLQLGSKGFFTIILHNLEDRNRIFEGRPYFYNSVGLFLHFWKERFSPKKEDFMHAPVWLRLYSLPQELWLEEILAGIGNTIDIYIKASEATKQRRYTTYARICVYLNISKPLPGAITLDYQDEEWSQTIDYEHIPFRCRKCMSTDISFA
jgi:hypothetical protein